MLVCPFALLVVAKVSLQAGTVPVQKPAESPAAAQTVEVDQTLVTLGTRRPLRRHRSYFRLVRRHFGDLASVLFTLDEGAIIGLGSRFGLPTALQAGFHRSILGKTIEAF